MLSEGMRIKIFPETQVEVYVDWIRSEGFQCRVHHDYIQVGKRNKRHQYDDAALGKMISAHRKAKGWNRYKLARVLNVHEDTVFKWENGLTQPKKERMELLLNELNISQEDLERCLK